MRKARLMSANELVPLQRIFPHSVPPYNFSKLGRPKFFWSCSFVQLLQGINGPPLPLYPISLLTECATIHLHLLAPEIRLFYPPTELRAGANERLLCLLVFDIGKINGSDWTIFPCLNWHHQPIGETHLFEHLQYSKHWPFHSVKSY